MLDLWRSRCATLRFCCRCWPVTIAGLEQHAHTVRVRLDGAPPVLADITPAVVAELRLTPGTRLWATVKATETTTYPR